MKISSIMNPSIDFVSKKTSVLEVARLIFGHGINGLPVCENKKVIGFITERDILSHFYPTVKEYIDDPFRAGDFEEMEEKITEILSLNASEIMSKNPITILADTPLLHAQSLMFMNKVSRLPVVNVHGIILGIVTKGDIFRALVGRKVPIDQEEEIYNWLAKHYDVMFDWKKRLGAEIPYIKELFRNYGAKSILDVASSNGEHVLALAKEGFLTIGIEPSNSMHEIAMMKRSKLSKAIKDLSIFINGSYSSMLSGMDKEIDAAIFMGNSLSHIYNTDKNILADVVRVLNKKRSMIVLQIINYNKIFNINKGLREFLPYTNDREDKYAITGFYEKKQGDKIDLTRTIFQSHGGRWMLNGVKTIEVEYITKDKITTLLEKHGYNDLSYFGASYNEPLLDHEFDLEKDDLLIVVAKR
ncbi:hypothetical protein LBMAG33_5190 [Candidatus Levyibacteriota bacterium]|nr:hypothetical protein LBMAG33_5190 [Candidatus Levybacteria bacterium]